MMEEPQRTYLTEFPKFGELDVELPSGFQDKSSRADAMPSFIKVLSAPDVLPVTEMVLTIDYVDAVTRRNPEGGRFTLLVMQDHSELLGSFETDDYAEILSGIQIVEAEYRQQIMQQQ